MTWDELKEEAKKMGYYMVGDEGIADDVFVFWLDGKIDVDGVCISNNRTPDQVFAIMKALQ